MYLAGSPSGDGEEAEEETESGVGWYVGCGVGWIVLISSHSLRLAAKRPESKIEQNNVLSATLRM